MSEQATIQDVENFWNGRPCNIKHSNLEVGTEEYFREVERRKYHIEPHMIPFAAYPRWEKKSVLELGCGIGTEAHSFVHYGAFYTGVDLSKYSVELTTAHLASLWNKNWKVYKADAESPGKIIPPYPFDLVYSFGVIHHTPHPERIIREVELRYSKPGTILKLMVYNKGSWKVFSILVRRMNFRIWKWWKWSQYIRENSEANFGSPITFLYTPKDIRKLLSESNWEIQKITKEHIFPYHIPDYVNYKYTRVWYFRWMPRKIFAWLEHRLGWHLCVTAIRK